MPETAPSRHSLRPKSRPDCPRPRLGSALAAALISATIWSACAGDAPDATTHTVVVDTTPAGIERITNRGDGLWRAEDAWVVDSAGLVIGALEGPEELTFGSVAAVAVSDDRIYVADGQAPDVRVFTRAGDYVSRLGRSGEGPGEFRNIDGVAIGPGGEIFVRDRQLARVSVFGPDGEFARSFPIRRPLLIYQDAGAFWVDQAGYVYDRVRLGLSIQADTVAVVSYDPDGSVADTAVVIGYDPPMVRISQGGRPRMGAPVPFTPRPAVAVTSGGGIVGGLGGSYELMVRDRAGTALRFVRRDVKLPGLPPRARDTVDAMIAGMLERAGGGEVSDFTLPDHLPAYTGLIIDADGYWWVGRSRDFRSLPTRYDVFDPEGRYLGEVQTPQVRIFQIGRDFVAARRTDELGVAYAVVYPLRR